jgi:alpha-mannosidase
LQEYRDFACPLICAELIGEAPDPGSPGPVALRPDTVEIAGIKKAEREDALVVRLWNPLPGAQEAELALTVSFAEALAADLNEAPAARGDVRFERNGKGGTVRVGVPGHAIVTVLVRGVNAD